MMKLLHKPLVRRILAAFAILIITALIEIISNFHGLTEGYEPFSVMEYVTAVPSEESKTEITYELHLPSDKQVYVNKLKMVGNFEKRRLCTMTVTKINAFDAVQVEELTDYTNYWFTDSYTPIHAKISDAAFTFNLVETEGLTDLVLMNEVQVNGHRIAFWLVMLTLLYLIFGESFFSRKPEYFFLIFATSVSLIMIDAEQIQYNGWDEEVHFNIIYQYATNGTYMWNQSFAQMNEARALWFNTSEEYVALYDHMEEGEEISAPVAEPIMFHWVYYTFSYLPQALFLKIGMALSMPLAILYRFGKLANLLVYIICMFFSIRLVKHNKIFLMLIACMPTILFMATCYTYDDIVLSFVTLGVVLWSNEMHEARDTYHLRTLVLSGLLMGLGCLAKPVYFPVLLLLYLAPYWKRLPRLKRWLARIAGAAIIVLIVGFFVQRAYLAVKGLYDFADARGGNVGMGPQIISMLHHPLETIRMFLHDITDLENFRNSGNPELNGFAIGNLMFLNFYWMGVLSDKWMLLMIPVILATLLVPNPEEKDSPFIGWKRRIVIGVIVLAGIALTWLALYLTFTPIGTDEIYGVQARYYIPLLYPLSLVVANRNVSIRMKYETMTRFAMVSNWIFAVASIYTLMLYDRLF